MGNWDGKVAIVTGSAMGIGEATARLFAERGASVILMDPHPKVAETSADIQAKGGRAVHFTGSVAAQSDVEGVCALAKDQFGRIDCVVNNAGIMLRRNTVEEWEADALQKVVDVNLMGTLLLCYKAAPIIAAKGGSIVNISSFGALAPVQYSPVYAATKAGVLGFTRSIAPMLADQGVRVCAVLPNFVDTPLTANAPGRGVFPTMRPEDVAQAIIAAAEDQDAAGKFYTAELIDGVATSRQLLDQAEFAEISGR